ncbi:restriction endonuclease subunit S [Candidatus Spongiihabitans sp.]|uniref:restriction endonuclease subunit S n=1 Tax=Candidatus Spongiihabitans sp. TaxID=3101308 RepID=UPI003C7CCDDC
MKWEQVALGDVCEVIAGQSPKSSNYNNAKNGLPFYQGKKEFTSKYLGAPTKWTTHVTSEAIAGDILMSVRAPVGPINFATERICIGRGLAAIRAAEQIEPNFLFYLLLSMQDQINGSEGAVFASINKNQIQCISFCKPPLAEQKRIVAVLDEAFAAIATATENTKKNLANAQELFDSELNRVFKSPDEYSVSDVAAHTVKIMDVVEPLTTTDPRKQPEESFEYIDVSSVSRITHSIRTTSPTLGCDAPSRAKRLVRAGDVLFATIRPTLQRIAIVPAHLDQAICSTGYFVLRPKPDVNSRFLFYYLFSQPFSDEMALLQRGASYPAVSDRDVKEHLIHLPPLPEQNRIATFLDKLSAEKQTLVETYKTKIRSLVELKQSLLHQAFIGELTSK